MTRGRACSEPNVWEKVTVAGAAKDASGGNAELARRDSLEDIGDSLYP